MKPDSFPGQNIVMGEGQPEYLPVPAERNAAGDTLMCFALDDADLATIMRTGRIWIMLKTFNTPMQPILVSVERPQA